MKRFASLLVGVAGFVTILASAGLAGCVKSPSGFEMCGSGVTEAEPKPDMGKWYVQSKVSPMDDSKTVMAVLLSNESVPGMYGGPSGNAGLTIRCMESTTSVLFDVNNHFMADHQGFGRVEFRVDGKKASHVNAEVSTDNMVLGLWSGKRSIPFIKGLFGGEMLTVRITPFNESPITLTYRIAHAEEAMKELREACKW